MKFPSHKCSLTLQHNDHKDYYETAAQWYAHTHNAEMYDWPSEEALARAIATNEIWTLQWYPNTPNGFNAIAAPTLEELLAFASKEEEAIPAEFDAIVEKPCQS